MATEKLVVAAKNGLNGHSHANGNGVNGHHTNGDVLTVYVDDDHTDVDGDIEDEEVLDPMEIALKGGQNGHAAATRALMASTAKLVPKISTASARALR